MSICKDCIHYEICDKYVAPNESFPEVDGCKCFKAKADVVEVRHSRIKWVNRPISAQYATVTDEYGEKHYGKVHDFIENNPVGYCGECGKRLDDTFMNFCPNCGAKMDGERSENGNLNAEAIKTALECCTVGIGTECEKCPYMRTAYCNDVLKKEALALITSQEQRIGAQDMTISELRQRAEKAEHDADRYAQKNKELTEENESLKHECDNCAGCTQWKFDCSNIRAEAIHEFAERLKKDFLEYKHDATITYIDQIAKEMLEDKLCT